MSQTSATALVSMPFAAVHYPSIQMGLLKSIAARASIDVDVYYLNLVFAKEIGSTFYTFISNYRGALLGEWLFADAAFGGDVPAEEPFLQEYDGLFKSAKDQHGISVDDFLRIRHLVVPRFVANVAKKLIEKQHRIVCFTSTFEQNVASFALAKAIKDLRPEVFTVFGGANFDGQMGSAYVDGIPWIDVAVSGEADDIFVPLLSGLLRGDRVRLDGVIWQGQTTSSHERATFKGPMDQLPAPDYDDYIAALRTHGLENADLGAPITMLIEGSRGCWWGEKHHCKFCGLNALGMGFRSKSTEQIISDIRTISKRYKVNRINAVDNIIGRQQLKALSSFMSDHELDYELFFEVKSNLSRKDVMEMADGAIKNVQPGIESFSTNTLKLMDKGISAIQNVNTLRWMAYYGINAFWNVIYGFPDETEDDYNTQISFIEKLHFLPPPRGVGPIWLERFSPYFRMASNGEKFSNLRPNSSYAYVYPKTVDINKAAYFFEADLNGAVRNKVVEGLTASINQWREKWKNERPPTLVFQRSLDTIRVIDRRDVRKEPVVITYVGLLAEVFSACVDKPVSVANICDSLSGESRTNYGLDAVSEALMILVRRSVVLQEGSLFLALPLPWKLGRRAELRKNVMSSNR